MAIELVVAKDLEEANYNRWKGKDCLVFCIEEKTIYDFLNVIKGDLDKIDKGCAGDFLYKLEIYGEGVLSKDRIREYLKLSEVMLNKQLIDFLVKDKKFEGYYIDYGKKLDKESYIEFANTLKRICTVALEENKELFVIGD